MKYSQMTRAELIDEVIALNEKLEEARNSPLEPGQKDDSGGLLLKQYQMLADAAPDFLFIIDKEFRVIYVNNYGAEKLGLPKEQVIGKLVKELLPREIFARQRFNLKKVFDSGKPLSFEGVFEFHGRETWLDTRLIPISNDGRIDTIFGVSRDTTDRKHTEQALQESLDRYKTLVETSPDAIVVTDLEGKITEISQQTIEIYGCDGPEELIGKSAFELIAPEDHGLAMANLQKTLKEGVVRNVEYNLIKKDGTPFIGELSAALIKKADGTPEAFIATTRDITHRKKMEEELIKKEKLESVGIFAGGLAHDFNNILTAIIGNIHFAKLKAKSDEDLTEKLLEAESALMRATDLTDQLLTFAKGGEPIKKPTDMPGLIREAASFALTGSKIKWEFSPPEDLWPADIDEGQIHHVLSNLIVNSKQAMQNDGTVTIKAENITVGNENLVQPLPDGKFVLVSVSDQGHGIKEKDIKHIFDPFFTTRPAGTGLGLSTAYSIVIKHNGHIDFETSEGTGTTFKVYLPASETEPSEKPDQAERPMEGEGNILLLDDEELILSSLSEMLESWGYKVTCTKKGPEAIEQFTKAKESARPFDLVIMDLTLPGGIGGKDVIKQLKEIDADVKAIVSSGYSHDPVMANFEKYGFCGVLAKPYKIEDLNRVLNKALQGNRII